MDLVYSSITQYSCFFFFNDTATTEIYTLSLHDALPISRLKVDFATQVGHPYDAALVQQDRSEEHTSELQSLTNLVCRLLLEKKKRKICTMDVGTVQMLLVFCGTTSASSLLVVYAAMNRT